MKTIKWLWVAALVTIGFRFYGAVSSAPNGTGAAEAEALVGLILAFVLLSAVWLGMWILGLLRNAVVSKLAARA